MKKLVFTSLFLTANTFVFAQVVPPGVRKPTPEESRIHVEKFYYDGIINGFQTMTPIGPQGLHGDTFRLFCEYVTTNSIPVLIKLNQELMDTNKDEGQAKLHEILQILLCIESPLAVEAIFILLDMADKKYGEKTVATRFNQPTDKTLREIIMADIFEPYEQKDNIPKWKKVVEGEKWQKMFKNYQSEKLSEKNQVFLTNARNLIRAREEDKPNE